MEIWKPVKDYEDLYFISSAGRIKNRKEKILNPPLSKWGYKTVVLNKWGNKKSLSIHRLVAIAFIKNIENKKCVNHKDFNRTNNNVENLEWVTHSENTLHCVNANRWHGFERGVDYNIKRKKSIENPNGKFCDESIKVIRQLYYLGFNYSKISTLFKISQGYFNRVIKNEVRLLNQEQ